MASVIIYTFPISPSLKLMLWGIKKSGWTLFLQPIIAWKDRI